MYNRESLSKHSNGVTLGLFVTMRIDFVGKDGVEWYGMAVKLRMASSKVG